MADVICRKCSEPWDQYYLSHEGLWDHPGEFAPAEFIAAHEALLDADEEWWEEHGFSLPPNHHYENGGWDLLRAIVKGVGCPACWGDPSRVSNSPAQEEEALKHNLFDSGYEGDPMEMLE